MATHDTILLEHGGGGLLTSQLVEELFLPHFKSPYLDRMEDSAVFTSSTQKLCFTTDSYVVTPLFFPGGNIGSLAVHGTVNDIAMAGGKPLLLSCGFILEEGLSMDDLKKVTLSMAAAAAEAGVSIAAGDTKVVPRGAADGMYINTSGIGIITYVGALSAQSILPGDAIIINGTIGDHGAAILSAREDIGLKTPILSDSASLSDLVETILRASPHIHCMRDATRGGLGGILAELASRSSLDMSIAEKDVPIKEAVRGLCEILGFDPLFLASEGKMVVFCYPADAPTVLQAMRSHVCGKDAAVIGKVQKKGRGRLVLQTLIGGERVVDLPSGELVPRIC